MTVTFDPYSLEDTAAPAPTPAKITRARKRIPDVSATGPDSWAVAGNKALSDAYPLYAVSFDGSSYDCDCYHTDHGAARAKVMCSHVLAVILARPNLSTFTRTTANRDTVQTSATPLADGGSTGDGAAGDIPAPSPVATVSDVSPTDRRWGAPPLPGKFTTLRSHQVGAVEQIEDAFTRVDLVMLDAPTGTGKSLLGELSRRRVAQQAVYICSSIPLQDQFTNDFTYAKLIRGRANYEPIYSDSGATCADCTASPPDSPECFFCPSLDVCPYRRAKDAAHRADLAVLNTSYWLHAANYTNEFADRGLVIVDEADMLEKELMGFVEFSITQWQLDRLGVEALKKGVHKPTIAAWFADSLAPAVKETVRTFPNPGDDIRRIRELQSLQRLAGSIARISNELAGGDDDNWVRDNDAGPMVLKPVKVSAHGPEHIWQHGKKFLLMSATLVSPDSIAESLGYDRPFETVKVPHTFPVENRRLVIAPVADMTYAKKDAEYPKMANALANIAARHPDERILVHSVSYALTKYLHDHLNATGFRARTLSYTNAKDRDRTLAKFRRTHGGILVAPSMDRGIDLPGDDCRVVVVTKMPYASLGDKQVSARMRASGGETWYAANTIRSLVQMTGRAVRSAEDHCITYILDAQYLSNVEKKSKRLIPEWFKEAVDYSFPVKELTQPFAKV